jgi:hypothetical protein
LLGNKVGGNDMNALDALSVLCSKGCSCCHGVAAMSSNDFLIRLKATKSE